ncbi:MAG: VOC family protein [Deltaproteobacteria bacterium]|nr:VOC family protein [Deltaproteobacteria bacterium]
MEINGVAHIMLTVSRFDQARPFYHGLLALLGMKPAIEEDGLLYYVGGRTAVGVVRGASQYGDERFVQLRVGLHHVCFRARARADVDLVHQYLRQSGWKIVHPPQEGPWAPGYYSVLFEDPDGIRIEVNHVPGKGLLEGGESKG